MADRLRAGVFDVGGRFTPVVDLNDLDAYTLVQNSLTISAPAKQPVMAFGERRWAGSRQVGETHDNGMLGWSQLVRGANVDQVVDRVAALLQLLERIPVGDLFIEWRPDGSTETNFYEVRATGSWVPRYEWAQSALGGSWVVDVQIPIAPLARGHRMDVYDPFTVDTRGDYTYDAGTLAGEQVVGGVLLGAGTLTTERRAIHTARGYQFVDSCQRCKATPGATITSFKAGRVIKRIDANNYIEGYVDDNGTNSRVRLDKVVAGVRTNLASTNLAARVVNGTPFWVRAAIVGNVVTVEHFTAEPGPLTAATTTAGGAAQTLRGTDATQFGSGVAGGYGRVWIPQHASASIDDEYATPYWSGSQTLPAVVQFGTPIPGDAPALADVTITHSGGTSPPIWALLGWTRRPGAGLAQAPFGILEAEAAGNLSGWSVVADATARGGSMLKDAAAASSDVYSASWEVDPSLLVADDFEEEVSIEVWARVMLSSTIVSPTFVLSLRPEDGLSFGAARYTDEWGTTGRILTKPSSGSSLYRPVRLGTLRARVDALRPRKWLVWLGASVGIGSSGAFGLDHLRLVPSRQRACSPSGVADDSGYPDFISSTAQTSKTICSDLSALVASPPKWGHPDHGLGGQLIELPPGNVDLLAKLSTLVPDDPTSNASTEQLAHTGVVEMSVTPRWNLLRS